LFDGGPIARDGLIALVRLLSGEDNPIRIVDVSQQRAAFCDRPFDRCDPLS